MEKAKNDRYIKLIAIIFTGAFAMLMCLLSRHVKQTAIKNDIQSDDVLPTKAPLALVILDPGHGGYDHGASGNKTGIGEDVINLAVSKATQSMLAEHNIDVVLTRNNDEAIASTKKQDMKERRRIMHESGATLTVSIHMNKFSDTAVHGPMVFYTKGDERSERLAECILRNICICVNIPNRLVNTGDYYVIRNSEIPAVIVECGFLSNPTEEARLCDPDYQMLLAEGISNGICEFIKETMLYKGE